MNKTRKKFLTGLLVVIGVLIACVLLWMFVIFPQLHKDETFSGASPAGEPQTVADTHAEVDFHDENGLLYVNNEIVVVAKSHAKSDAIEALAAMEGVTLDNMMADIGIYKFIYPVSMTYEDIESAIARIKKNKWVEKASFNVVSVFDTDTTEAPVFEPKPPLYPKDDWNGDTWDITVPRGDNWGMEAIDAPGAWAYSDQFHTVRVGMIDTMPDLAHKDLVHMFSYATNLFVDTKTGLTKMNIYSRPADEHGTHVSGIMNADWNNGIGVAGVMGGKGKLYYSKLYYDTDGEITSDYGTAYSYLLELKLLIDQDVQVINISLNTSRLVGFAAGRGNQNALNYLTEQADLTDKGLSRIIAARENEEKSDFVLCVAAGNNNNFYYYKDDKAPYGYRSEMKPWEKFKAYFGWRGDKGNVPAVYNNFLNMMSSEAVKNRVIVVGAVGIDQAVSTGRNTRYAYTFYSNVGSRVDLVAPGGVPGESDIYSCVPNGYAGMSGTSMATPHVAGVAGLIFACNPDLTGPEVKEILLASTTGRYYYFEGFSGLIHARTAVENALQTKHKPVHSVLKKVENDGLDLCFVVDTTSSMGDDIDNAKANMTEILEHLSDKTRDYRVALVDYRDFPARTGYSVDYPCKVQLEFTDKNDYIEQAIQRLDLGHGGDDSETVYSALMAAVKLDWRPNAKKVIIILGDASPLDPEPNTEWTYDDVLSALQNADIHLDLDRSDQRVLPSSDDSLINVYSIGTDADADATDFFRALSNDTGGKYSAVADASEVSGAIMNSIEQIDMIRTVSVDADFSDALSDQDIDLYREDDYLFSITTDERGAFRLDSMESDQYRWKCPELLIGGTIEIAEDEPAAAIRTKQKYWFTPIVSTWIEHDTGIIAITALIVLLFLLTPPIINTIIKRKSKSKENT